MRTALGVAVVFLALSSCEWGTEAPLPDATSEAAALARHAQEFTPARVVQAAEGVYVAIGFGLANSILLVGEDGVVVVDTLSSLEEARRVRAEFRKITRAPVRAIVYTHNHADHVFGARAFVDEGVEPEIYAHETTSTLIDRVVTELRPALARRSFRMFGVYLDEGTFANAGIGPRLGLDERSGIGLLKPTKTVSDRLSIEIAGIRLELVHAPGETDDQLFVWLPDRRVLLPGDNFYKAFPNLYTIRGTPYRSLEDWASSLDRMRALRAKALVPSHTRPIQGSERIDRVLTDYRDAIRYVHDQTVRGINRGLTPDELVEYVRLPPHLADSPYLQEFYGKVSWSVRSVFAGKLGWFDGNPSTLDPLSPLDHARRLAQLAGGEDRLDQAVLEAAERGDHQWVLQLSDHALRLDPGNSDVIAARVHALEALASRERNPNARHYYLTRALELEGHLEIEPLRNATPELLAGIATERFLEAMAVQLDAGRAARIDRKVAFTFPDTGEEFTLWVRRGVLETRRGRLPDSDLHVRVDAQVWKEVLAGTRSASLAIARDVEVLKGGRIAFARFLRLFDATD